MCLYARGTASERLCLLAAYIPSAYSSSLGRHWEEGKGRVGETGDVGERFKSITSVYLRKMKTRVEYSREEDVRWI